MSLGPSVLLCVSLGYVHLPAPVYLCVAVFLRVAPWTSAPKPCPLSPVPAGKHDLQNIFCLFCVFFFFQVQESPVKNSPRGLISFLQKIEPPPPTPPFFFSFCLCFQPLPCLAFHTKGLWARADHTPLMLHFLYFKPDPLSGSPR